jgi:hypothetical protein
VWLYGDPSVGAVVFLIGPPHTDAEIEEEHRPRTPQEYLQSSVEGMSARRDVFSDSLNLRHDEHITRVVFTRHGDQNALLLLTNRHRGLFMRRTGLEAADFRVDIRAPRRTALVGLTGTTSAAADNPQSILASVGCVWLPIGPAWTPPTAAEQKQAEDDEDADEAAHGSSRANYRRYSSAPESDESDESDDE